MDPRIAEERRAQILTLKEEARQLLERLAETAEVNVTYLAHAETFLDVGFLCLLQATAKAPTRRIP